jgi:phosphoethanolamine N-methyltransferase
VDSQFLDSNQYTPQGISSYESIWGTGFVSPGGAQTAREFLAELDLGADALVLDVGCGLGGSAFLMATEFNFRVEGLDFSRNMLERARTRCTALGLDQKVLLQYGDALELSAEGRYDAVYSRDAFLHIASKQRLFRNLLWALRPGGTLLFTDYCCSPKPWSGGFRNYVESHHYSLHTLLEYEGLMREAGFVDIETRDLSEQFIRTLDEDLALLSQKESDETLVRAWRNKLSRARSGEQKWGFFKARKSP